MLQNETIEETTSQLSNNSPAKLCNGLSPRRNVFGVAIQAFRDVSANRNKSLIESCTCTEDIVGLG